jgi:phosphoglycerate dehydrogenase-like enzyme
VARAVPVSILVYHPDGPEPYAERVRAPDVVVRTAATPEAAAAVIGDVDVIYGWGLPSRMYREASRLRWVQVMGAGVDAVLTPALPRGVAVTRTPGIFGPWMAEYVLGWALSVTQRVTTYRDAQRARRWIGDVIPERLGGRTMAVVGLGNIGQAVARAAAALGMDVVGVSRAGRSVRGVRRVHRSGDLVRVLGAADWVVLTVPLTETTRGLIGRRELAAMRPTAWLINIARGAIVDDAALREALGTRRIAGAILDVFTTEPLPADDPLWTLPNVIVTPHISGPSTPDEIAPIFEDNLARFRTGRPLRHVVNRRRGY